MVKAKPTRRDHHLRLVEYLLPGRWKVLVGRTDADNDYLSLKLARPDDWWFHVRGVPGGHVILQGPVGEDPDRETLKRAAAIAAYHSKARRAGLVAVSCTRARYVTKPRDAKAGTVQIRKEIVLKVRPATGEALADMGDDSTTKTS
jgi:predicted ribosome quality control (RQC) complex YloA/Tae2 family protein